MMLKVALILSIISPFIVAQKFSVVNPVDAGSNCNELTIASKHPNKHSDPLAESCINTIAKHPALNADQCRYCPPGLVPSDFGTFCFALTPSWFGSYNGISSKSLLVWKCYTAMIGRKV